ncbi:MAG: nucleotidyltransferase family protein [Candidatus Melainabacteria bacterium]|nr:nucleotidyltransferase family protein [Candidatus Melainabacteria bacterium]
MDAADILKLKQEKIKELAARHGAYNVRIFGSIARGKSTAGSDIDLLVDFEHGRTIIDHVRLIRELEELLGCKVDVATVGWLKPRIRERVLRECVPL